ncbi:MAG: YIP1 family protein [Holophagaceae bacterium]|uniref:YIP1 family protein n=1 Tax=Candidatus Geothrix odensensis TaxID=2954440 RepID=A0A936K6P5_9BACT|nr:YIP1 family protein [Candidatus Geothrix odensensis]
MSEITGPNEAIPPVIQLNEPPVSLPPQFSEVPAFTPALRPVPFEDPEAFPSFWSRVGGMFRLVFSNPMELFDRVPVTEGLGAPWRFLLLLSIPVFLVMALVFFLVGMGIMLAALEQTGKGDGKAIAAIMPVLFGVILLLMPLFSFLGMVIGGAFNHFFLWLWGGLRPGVGTGQSIRAYGYASAFIQIGGLIPYIGILIHLAGMIVIGMGMARMHKTDTWRGICAVLTPLFLLCCCGLLAALSVPALIAASQR